jgi:phosphoglycolate phosphatase-like HAD superfamily hydrolase
VKQKIFKAALFDLDGVVFDTEPQYTVFWGGICREYHPEHPGLEHEIKGQTLTQIYDRWFAGPLLAEQASITDRLNDYERQMNYDYISGFEVNFQTAVLGQGTARSDTLRLLGLEESDKSVIFSVIREEKTEEIMRSLDEKFHKIKNGKGIAFTIPLTSVIGVAIYRFLSNNKTV